MGGLAQLGAGDRLDVVGPPPAGLEGEAADLAATDLEEVHLPAGKRPGFVRRGEALLLCLCHRVLLSGSSDPMAGPGVTLGAHPCHRVAAPVARSRQGRPAMVVITR